jgi:hypothetical protein
MEDIDQVYLAAFTYFVERHKTQKEFADCQGAGRYTAHRPGYLVLVGTLMISSYIY